MLKTYMYLYKDYNLTFLFNRAFISLIINSTIHSIAIIVHANRNPCHPPDSSHRLPNMELFRHIMFIVNTVK